MAFSRRFSRRRRSRTPKGIKEWLWWETLNTSTFVPETFLLGPGQNSTDWLIPPFIATDEFDEPTILRLLIRRWDAWVTPNDPAIPIDSEGSIMHGILVCKGGSDTASVNGVPPIDATRGDYDWLWWESVHFATLAGTLGTPVASFGVTELGSTFGPYGGVIDIRTKRRIGALEGLLYVNFCPASNTGGSVMGYTSGRLLMVNH